MGPKKERDKQRDREEGRKKEKKTGVVWECNLQVTEVPQGTMSVKHIQGCSTGQNTDSTETAAFNSFSHSLVP